MTIRNKSIKTRRFGALSAALAISLALSACGNSEESLEPETLALVDESTTSTSVDEPTTSTPLDESTTTTTPEVADPASEEPKAPADPAPAAPTAPADDAPPASQPPVTDAPADPPADPPVAADDLVEAEAESFRLLNELRASLGLAPLARTGVMDSFARNWSQTMAMTGNFEHSTGPYGENIAWNSQGSLTPAEAAAAMHEMWINSPGHYANMTNADYTLAGVGFYSDASGWHATHVFDR